MHSEIKGEVVRITYETGGAFTVKLDGASTAVVANDVFNQLAVDAAFERRARVVLELDGDRIHRVQSDVPSNRPDPPPPGKAVLVTRISTQVNGTTGDLIAEIFFSKNPGGAEEQGRTTDSVIHLLCHGAYLNKHPLRLELAQTNVITAVTKERIDIS
jgi:hypothetical protein